MGKKSSEQERRLLHMLNSPQNNNKCGECKAIYPTWASWNLGVFLCGRCASVHRILGKDVSCVKSLSLDNWASYELDSLESLGNKENQRIWNNKRVPFPFDDDDKSAIELYLRDKYINGDFRNTPIEEDDYNLSNGRRSGGGGGLFSRGSRSRSFRSHSKDDSYEYGSYDSYKHGNSRPSSARSRSRPRSKSSAGSREVYKDRARKMKYDYGFEDEEQSIDALIQARGNVKEAVDILKRQGVGSRSQDEEKAPPLPKRRATAGSLMDSSKTGSNNFDWLSGDAAPSTATSAMTGATAVNDSSQDVQIFQYVDPNTGAIYYIDSNGQQYMDPSQQQQQQLAMMQQQQQQQQQQQIMAAQQTTQFGGMPGLTGSTLASTQTANTGQPSLNELSAMQQQQQQLQLQQQQMAMMQQQTAQAGMGAGMGMGMGGMMYGQQTQPQQQQNYFTGF